MYFILIYLHVSVDSDYHRDANTKSQSKVKYNAGIFTLIDPTNLQYLLQHKLYKSVKFSKD